MNDVPIAAAQRSTATLLMLSVLSTFAFMDRQIVAVLVPPVKAEFALSDLQAGLVTGVGFAIGFGLFGVPLGRLADRRERLAVVAWCRGIGGALAALGAAAGSAWMLAATRVGGAVSDAGGAPGSMAIIADLYPPQQRSRAMSVFTMAASLGSLLALIVGAWLSQRWGWRATLSAIGGVSLAAALALRRVAREPPRTAHGAGGHAERGAVAAIWREPVVRSLIVAAGFALLAGYSFAAWNFAYLMRGLGLTSQQAGWVAGTSALASLLGAPVSGMLADRLARREPRWQLGVPVVGLGIALPLGWVYLAIGASHPAAGMALVIGFAFFVGWWVAPTYAALSLVVAPECRAMANAMLLMAGAVGGGGIGPVLTGGLSDLLGAAGAADPLRVALAAMLALLLPAMAGLRWAMRPYALRRAALPG